MATDCLQLGFSVAYTVPLSVICRRHGYLCGVTLYRRFESAVPNRRGVHPGVFALANGLAAAGALSVADRDWWKDANLRANHAYVDPTTVRSDCYDPVINPGARAWFKEPADDLIEFTGAYLRLLDRHDVPWVDLRTSYPGRVTYEDDVQLVAVPLRYPEDWPFNLNTPS